MAEPLKNSFGIEIVRTIARQIRAQWPAFPTERFVHDVVHEYESLDLVARARKIATVLRDVLPADYDEACELLIASLGPKLERTEGNGMAPFLYLPHVIFVANYGLDSFEASMRAQYELTQRFSAEYSIRAYLERHPERTLALLEEWAHDPSVHVRRLVSEGTRPRLPWAPRLRQFQKDPAPVLALLELLKDDPELYVRRSVANNLNDIGKDHPDILAATAKRWLQDASEERRWVVQHALRSAVKRGEAGALDVLGYGSAATVDIEAVTIEPARPRIGQSIAIAFTVSNATRKRQRVLADLRIHFVKANSSTSAKVFKLDTLDLAGGERRALRKTISLKNMTTRKHYPGTHVVEVVINGRPRPLGAFTLLA